MIRLELDGAGFDSRHKSFSRIIHPSRADRIIVATKVTEIAKASADQQRKALIDEFGDLEPLVEAEKIRAQAFKLRVGNRHGELAKLIVIPYLEKEPALSFTESGAKHTVLIGARAFERKITKRSVLKRLLGAKFNDLWEIALGVIDKTIPAEDHPLFLVKDRTGRRSVDVIPPLDPRRILRPLF